MVERCRDAFPVRMMCRLLKVSTSGYYDWRDRKPSPRAQDNARLFRKIVQIHHDSDGVFGSPRVWEDLQYAGETCSLNRVARLMNENDLAGIPAMKQWRKRQSTKRPSHVLNHLERDFTAPEPDIKWVRYYLYSNWRGLALSGGDHRFIQRPGCWLVYESYHGKAISDSSCSDGTLAKAA